MRRLILALAGACLLLALPIATVAALDDTLPHTGRAIFVVGDVAVPAGEQADAVFVAGGTADISGTVNALFVVDGDASLVGATVGTVTVVHGTVTLGPGSHVLGDVWTLDATVQRDPSAVVDGSVGGLEERFANAAVILVPVFILMTIGVAVVGLVAALILAALAARQVRTAGDVIRYEPGKALGVGILGVLVPPVVAVLLMFTIVGIPLALAFLFLAWPAVGFVGYLVAAIFVGDAIVARIRGRREERPYLASVLGVIVLAVVGVVPFVTAVASLFGLGAVVLVGWRVWRGSATGSTRQVASPA